MDFETWQVLITHFYNHDFKLPIQSLHYHTILLITLGPVIITPVGGHCAPALMTDLAVRLVVTNSVNLTF